MLVMYFEISVTASASQNVKIDRMYYIYHVVSGGDEFCSFIFSFPLWTEVGPCESVSFVQKAPRKNARGFPFSVTVPHHHHHQSSPFIVVDSDYVDTATQQRVMIDAMLMLQPHPFIMADAHQCLRDCGSTA
jgi:hypothetical protein